MRTPGCWVAPRNLRARHFLTNHTDVASLYLSQPPTWSSPQRMRHTIMRHELPQERFGSSYFLPCSLARPHPSLGLAVTNRLITGRAALGCVISASKCTAAPRRQQLWAPVLHTPERSRTQKTGTHGVLMRCPQSAPRAASSASPGARRCPPPAAGWWPPPGREARLQRGTVEGEGK